MGWTSTDWQRGTTWKVGLVCCGSVQVKRGWEEGVKPEAKQISVMMTVQCGPATIDVVRRGHKMVVSWNRGTPNPQLANIFVLKCIKTHDVIFG